MKHFYIIAIILLFLISACHNRELDLTRDIISQTKGELVEDEREALFDIHTAWGDGRILITGETNLSEARTFIERRMKMAGLDWEDRIVLLPSGDLAKTPWGLINLSVANIRRTASLSDELVSQAILGTPVQILKKKGNWYFVQTPDKYLGWINSFGVVPMGIKEMDAWKNSNRVIYLGDTGLIYSGPSLDSEPIMDIVMGAIIEIRATKNDFIQVILPDGRQGYLKNSAIKDFNQWKNEVLPNRESIVQLARQFNGRPYVWGGTSVKGLDCSGFVKVVYFSHGVILARDASLMIRHGKQISIEDAKPGDLLFWGYEGDEQPRVTHVGFYTGDRKIIHASGRVRQNSIDSTKHDYFTYEPGFLVDVREIIESIDTEGIVSVKNHSWY